jgi:thiol-disulfide isomerase/thioredoxin
MSNKPSRSVSHSSRVQKASQAGQGRSWVLWIALAAVVLFAGVIAVGVSRSSSSASGGGDSPSGGTVVPSGDLNFGTVEVDGTGLPAAGQGTTDAAIGQEMPTVTGEQFDGSAIVIGPTGKPTVVMSVAHWCPHCQAEVPRIQEWLDQNGMPTDVELMTVATSTNSTRPNYGPGQWLRREGWSVPTLVDDESNTAAQAFGVSGFPAFLVVGADGKVIQRASGELTTAQFEQLIEAARSGQPASV